uniref:Transposable element protein, putative n=2 Tax=Oryza sativa subsp. japonica TaxID=39947 RepID=Q2R573_ORYSJ|nr:Transposable element protein, putative [Oryza sativa Japonica Group]ABA93315.1 Transposable element protein, putative, Retrotrans_gag [Oryza sativa Japonica Group]
MASKTLREFAFPSADNVAVEPQVNIGDVDFDLKSSLIMMAQASLFCGKPNEDANAHLQQFLEICSTYTIKGVSPDAVRLRLFPFSLLGRAKQWFYANHAAVNTWDKCSTAFLSKFFPMGKTNALRGRISSFQQTRDESIPEAWERLQDYNFHNGLTPMSRNHLDTTTGGAFFSKTVQGAVELIEKMVSNMGWSEERLQTRQRGMHTVKETELVAAKLELLMKHLDDHEKRPQGTVKALDSHVTCEVCGGTGHLGNDCPETREEAMYMGNNNGKKLAANDKILENINVKLDGFASAFQNQLSYNKMIETQLARLQSLVPTNETGRIPGQPDSSIENVKAITMTGGTIGMSKEAPSNDSAGKEIQPEKTVPQEYCNTRLLPFPQRMRKPSVDEQFARFVEVIQKIHINVPLLDAMQVPTYAHYLKDILNNKRPLPTMEVVKLTEQCSNVILHKLPEKKKYPGCPTITCSIRAQQFDQALCDLGASVSVMPKDVFDKLKFTVLAPTPMRLQLADSSVRYPAGIAEDVPVKIRDFFTPVDFVVLDMDTGKETPLILGRPFLSTGGANIDMGTGSIHFHINRKEERFEFQPRTEQCSMVKIKYRPNPQNIQVVEVEPPKKDSLVKFMQNFLEKETMMPRNRYWKTPVKSPVPAKKLEQPAQKKLSSAPKPKKVWKEKPKTPALSPPATGGKSVN